MSEPVKRDWLPPPEPPKTLTRLEAFRLGWHGDQKPRRPHELRMVRHNNFIMRVAPLGPLLISGTFVVIDAITAQWLGVAIQASLVVLVLGAWFGGLVARGRMLRTFAEMDRHLEELLAASKLRRLLFDEQGRPYE